MANVLREGISKELPEETIEGAVKSLAATAQTMITGGDATPIGEGIGAFVGIGPMGIGSIDFTSDSDAEGIIGAIYTQGSDVGMVGVAIVPDIGFGNMLGDGFMVIASGTEVSNIPTAGEFSYVGSNFIYNLDDVDEDTLNDDFGTFGASVNFATGKGGINLSFENIPFMIGGDFNVDTATGIFVGDDLEISRIFVGDGGTATIHGNFHGDGAAGMTGIYTDNVAEPNFIGAIAGHQQFPLP